MKPPAWVCEQISRIHPRFRLAWVGDPDHREPYNSGRFALIQLFENKKCGTYWEPKMLEIFWDVDVTMPLENYFRVERSYRGPIFSADGTSSERDWDQQYYKPILMTLFDEAEGWDNSAVMSGEIIPYIKQRTMRAHERKRRLRQQAVERGRRLESRIKELSEQMTEDWLRMGNETGETGVNMAWKHAKEDLTPRYKRFKEKGMSFDDYYLKHEGHDG